MAKKVFTLAPNVYFGKQLGKGGRNQIPFTLLGCALFYFSITQFKKPVEKSSGNVKQLSVDGHKWF